MLRSWKCSFNCENNYSIERKAIDTSGQLGSLYDASTDTLINQIMAPASETKLPDQRSVCRIFSNHPPSPITSYLRDMGVDDALRQSILLRMIIPTGVSRLIDYNQSIDENTRILYYSYRSRKENLSIKARKSHPASPYVTTDATHMITKILWGIEILFIVQISRKRLVADVDKLLNYIYDLLQDEVTPITLNGNQAHLIEKLNITVFGTETCINKKNLTMINALANIRHWQSNTDFHRPLNYTMQSLRWLYNNDQFRKLDYLSDHNDPNIVQIEEKLVLSRDQINKLERRIQQLPTNFSSYTLHRKLRDIQDEYQFLRNRQNNRRECLRKVLVDVRRRHNTSEMINTTLADPDYNCLEEKEIEQFNRRVRQLLAKKMFLNRLMCDRIEYTNVMDIMTFRNAPATFENIDTVLKRYYSNENGRVVLWYSTDLLKGRHTNRYKDIYQRLISARRRITQPIKLIYADFTQCNEALDKFRIVRLPMTETSESGYDYIDGPRPSNSKPTRPSSVLLERPRRPSILSFTAQSPSSVTELNVLLLGETGVGKSTFINAFVNYLQFETFQQAEQGESIVLIQSVTQQCRSYEFDLNDRIHLRLIDTPGIGDIRGATQDVKTMDHILTYVNNLSHLNAVCLFLKPNSSPMNVFFRSGIDQLFTYLTPLAYHNIIFCFTNVQTTAIVGPYDTRTLLPRILTGRGLNDIPCGRQNTFCFDNASFLYLAAEQYVNNFDVSQTEDYTTSWITSVNESVRLLNFIQTRQPYVLDEWLSPRKITLEISMLARPLMETLRLKIYNWRLSENESIGNRIELNSNPIAFEMCTHCAQINTVEVGPFWLAQYQPAFERTVAAQHRYCSADRKHFLVEAIIQHELVDDSADHANKRERNSVLRFLFECDKLTHYFRQQRPLAQGDPFQPILERFLDEEQEIAQIRNINSNMNRIIQESLQFAMQIRRDNRRRLAESNERLLPYKIYEIINRLVARPMVKTQIDSIKRSRELKMAAHECRISRDLVRNRLFIRLASSLQ